MVHFLRLVALTSTVSDIHCGWRYTSVVVLGIRAHSLLCCGANRRNFVTFSSFVEMVFHLLLPIRDATFVRTRIRSYVSTSVRCGMCVCLQHPTQQTERGRERAREMFAQSVRSSARSQRTKRNQLNTQKLLSSCVHVCDSE